MSIFVEYEDDPGFKTGQHVRVNGTSCRIIGIRDNGRGLWLSLTTS